jgi:hypothetical protein
MVLSISVNRSPGGLVSAARSGPTRRANKAANRFMSYTEIEAASGTLLRVSQPESGKSNRSYKILAKAENTENLYKAEYLGSGTFIITKPKRKPRKLHQSKVKSPQRGARKS